MKNLKNNFFFINFTSTRRRGKKNKVNKKMVETEMVKVALCQVCGDYKDINKMKNIENIDELYVCIYCENKYKHAVDAEVNKEFYEKHPDLARLNGHFHCPIGWTESECDTRCGFMDKDLKVCNFEPEDELTEILDPEPEIKIKLGTKQKKILMAFYAYGAITERELRAATNSNPDNHLFTVLKTLMNKNLVEKLPKIDKPNDWFLTELGHKYCKQNF